MRQTTLIALLLAATGAYADVTLRYKSDMKWAPGVPKQMIEQSMKMPGVLGGEHVLQARPDKAYSSMGPFRSVVDLKTQQMTMIDSENQRYCTTGAQQFADEAAKLFSDLPPEAKQAMSMMKISTDSRVTGRTATIQGIEAEEREAVMSVEGPPAPNMPPGPMIKMTLHFWTAKAGQGDRFPAVRELEALKLSQYAGLDAASMLHGMFQQMAGMGEGLEKFIQEMRSSNTLVLRTQMEMAMPALAAMMKQLPPDKNPFGADFDGSVPLFQMSQELAEISTAPIPDSVFAVPAGYKEAPLADMLRDYAAKMKGNAAGAPAPAKQ